MNTVMSSQNVTTNTNIVTASTRKLRNVNPSLTNSIAILHVSDAQYAYSSLISAVSNTRGLAAQAADAEGVLISVEPNQRPTSVFKKQAATTVHGATCGDATQQILLPKSRWR